MSVDVKWVLTNGSYEVSSKDHLIQIMNSGNLYTNTGTPPSNLSNVSYIQTNNIELESDITNIVSTFSGTYNGQEYSISNWSCTPPSGKGFGIFGYFVSRVLTENIALDGIWCSRNIIDGGVSGGHCTRATIYNIRTNFASGTQLHASSNSLGLLLGYTGYCYISGVTVGGIIDEL